MHIFVIILVAVTALLPGEGRAGKTHPSPEPTLPPAIRDLSNRESLRAIEMIFRGRTRTALDYLDSLSTQCGGEPLFLLTRARTWREFLPVDDERKVVLSEMAEPLYEDLDACIDLCTRRIESGSDDPKLYLYRGWAWMFKSHVHTFERAFWSAGREAKKGKNDLEKYLRSYPNDPIANSIMGAFLYFADTLPAAYKFVSKLLFLPGGDRERGLEMMELSVGWNSLVEMDNRLILYSVYIGFEGRYEEGLDGFGALQRQHPMHATFLRPTGVMLPLQPRYRVADRERIDEALARLDRVPERETERATYWLLHFFRAYANRFYDPKAAIAGFESLIEAEPEHPDWLRGYSAFELGRIKAARGERGDAERLFLAVVNDERARYIHSEARDMMDELSDAVGSTAPDDSLVASIYSGEATRLGATLRALEAVERPSAARLFYIGEARLAAGDELGALDAYSRAAAESSPRWDESFRMVAAARAGELSGVGGDFDSAAKHFSRARKFWHKEYLYDWLLEGRERYFKRLAEGKETTPTRWFAVR